MATLEWKCMACDRIFKPDELIADTSGAPMCPSCKGYDVFPQRYFRCCKCGFEAEQHDFFPEISLDMDPEDNEEETLLKNYPAYHVRWADNLYDPDGEECESYQWIQIR
jgi:DNA-directed RNA polymerase subunit RPC12/RpoP